MDPDVFERLISVDLLGVWRTVRAALPQIVSRRGHVVLVSSVYASSNGMGATPYAIAKAGIEQLGRALRAELAQQRASASVAYFAFIDTELFHQAIDRDPLAARMLATYPHVLHKRLAPWAAGEAIAAGIERRAPRIIRPRRWVAMSMLRGLINRSSTRAPSARPDPSAARRTRRPAGRPTFTDGRHDSQRRRRRDCKRPSPPGATSLTPAARGPWPRPRRRWRSGAGRPAIVRRSGPGERRHFAPQCTVMERRACPIARRIL
jgi:short chain dehydrogenase